jgi:RHS repeat-associated protein
MATTKRSSSRPALQAQPCSIPLGRLHEVNKGTAATTTRFLYDGVDMIAEYSSTNAISRRYVHGPGSDEPLLAYEGSTLATKRYLTADERGSIVAVTDGTGTVQTINKYDEYGQPATTNAAVNVGGRFGYTGQMWLPEVSLWYYKSRIYSPVLGRFMQTDPIRYADGLNWYNYVDSNPVNYVDPFGTTGREVCSTTDTSHWDGEPFKSTWVVSGRITCQNVPDIFDLIYAIDGIDGIYDGLSDVACSAANAINEAQNQARGTLQVGVAATGTLNPAGVTGGAGVAMDGKGNIGIYGYTGALVGVGAGADANVSVQGSNASSITDLSGWFINSSVHGGAGAGGSADMFVSPDGSVKGGGVTAGPSLSASGNIGATYTGVAPLINPLNGLKFSLETAGHC